MCQREIEYRCEGTSHPDLRREREREREYRQTWHMGEKGETRIHTEMSGIPQTHERKVRKREREYKSEGTAERERERVQK